MLTSRFGSGYGMGYSAFKEASALADAGNFVTVIHGNIDVVQYRDSRIRLIHISMTRTPIVGFVLLFFRLRRLFKNQIDPKDFDVVYIQSLEFGVVNFKQLPAPVFYFARSTMAGMRDVLRKEGKRLSVVDWFVYKTLLVMESRCFVGSKRVFAKSFLMREEISNLYGIAKEKVEVISGGIDVKDFFTEKKTNNLRTKLGIDSKACVFLYAGRVVPQKGLMYFVESAICALENSSFVVLIAGSSDDEAYFATVKNVIASSRHQEAFHFLGHVDQMEMSAVYSAVDCLVTPSLYEPFGMVNLQAAFLNKFVITTTVTGSSEVLVGYAKKVIVQPGSVIELEKALVKVLSWREARNFSSMDFADYTWSVVAKQILKYFTESLLSAQQLPLS